MIKDLTESCKAFTLAEVLITLAIIGIISAIVIPTIIKDYNDRKYNTARLKALKTFGEAGKLASINGEIKGQSNARAFVENVLSKYLKIVKICDTASECGFPSKIQPVNPSSGKKNAEALVKWSQIGWNTTNISSPTNDSSMSIYIRAVDEFSAKLFYNPKCVGNFKESSYAVDEACMNVVFDMNGKKGPNHVGEDVGIVTTFWDGLHAVSVAPGIIPYEEQILYNEGRMLHSDAQTACSQLNKDGFYTLPNLYELLSLSVNYYITSLPNSMFWTASSSGKNGFFYYVSRNGNYTSSNASFWVWCVKR